MREARIWALVADETRARILRGLEDGPPEVAGELIARSRARHLRDHMADGAGRHPAAKTPARPRTAEEAIAPVRRDIEDFAAEIAGFLDMHRRAEDFDRLAIFAPHPMLGALCAWMPPALRATVFLERDRTLIGLSAQDLRTVLHAEVHQWPGDSAE